MPTFSTSLARRRRGTAEIELLLVTPLLIALLLLVLAAYKIGSANLGSIFWAQNVNYAGVVGNHQLDDLQALGVGSITQDDPPPGVLPDRYSYAVASKTRTMFETNTLVGPITYNIDHVFVLQTGTYHYANWPYPSDVGNLQQWFEEQLVQQDPTLKQSLGLADPWAP
jgi:hypothetical protein